MEETNITTATRGFWTNPASVWIEDEIRQLREQQDKDVDGNYLYNESERISKREATQNQLVGMVYLQLALQDLQSKYSSENNRKGELEKQLDKLNDNDLYN